jgi:AcrR family transcriptional regulator
VKPRIVAKRGRYLLQLPDEERELVRQLLGELRTLLANGAEDPRLRRLYPAAYANDPEQQDEYRRMTQEELESGRLAAIETVERTADASELTPEELTSWMHAVNALRLVLGTMLDVGEEDPFDVDPDDPNARSYMLYGYLGLLLEEIVQAQLS